MAVWKCHQAIQMVFYFANGPQKVSFLNFLYL